MFMKTIVFLLLLATGYTNFVCPVDENDQPVDGVFRDPTRCHEYYHCMNGTAHYQACPAGLHFRFTSQDCRYQLCVDPAVSDCETLEASSRIEQPVVSECKPGQKKYDNSCYTKTSECDVVTNGTVASLVDCRLYYHCINGQAWPQQCPTGFFFNPNINVRECSIKLCVPYEDSQCPVEGAWSEWAGWSPCEPSCGVVGIRTRSRKCDNPAPANGGRDCPGNAVESELCGLTPCESLAESAAMVSLSGNTYSYEGYRMNWTSIDVNNQDLFNPVDNNMVIRRTGMYYFSLTGTFGKPFNSGLKLKGVGRDLAAFQSERAKTNSVATRGGLFQLTSLNRPYVTHEHIRTRYTGSSSKRETSWLGFFYDSDNYGFAARDSDFTGTIIDLPIVMAQRGIAINSGKFKIFEDGFYFVNYGIGHKYFSSNSVNIYVNGTLIPYQFITRMQSYGFDEDARSRSTILYLTKGSELSFGSRVTRKYGSSPNLETYLLTFKLNSSTPIYKVEGIRRTCNTFSYRQITFETKAVDTANTGTVRSFRAPVNGTYYVDLTISFGSINYRDQFIRVLVNNKVVLGMPQYFYRRTTAEMSTKTGLIKLRAGDIVTTSFTGCLGSSGATRSSFIIFLQSRH